MRILFLNHNLIGRGTWFRCVGLARELAPMGHRVDLWTASRDVSPLGARWIEDGVTVWRTPRWGRLGRHDGGYAPVDNLTRLLAATLPRWDIVHAFDHRPNVLLPWLWLRAQSRLLPPGKKPLFVSDWCDWWTAGGITTERRPFAWIDRLEQRVEEGSKRMSRGVTVISQVLFERALSVGVDKERLLLLPAGVALERFPTIDKTEARAALNLPLDIPILGFVGFSLWDMDLLAEAFAVVRQRHTDARLMVVGGGVEEEAINILRQRFPADALILPGALSFDELPPWLASCDVHLLPMKDSIANRARVPNKLADYYASARPVVASDVGETARCIREHRTGLLGASPRELGEAALRLLDDPDFAQSCGNRGRQVAATSWSYTAHAHRLLEFYARVAER